MLLYIVYLIPCQGACPWCAVLGIWNGKTTVYPGALALVPAASPARALWATYQPGDPLDDGRSSGSDENDEDVPAGRKNCFNAHVNTVIKQGIQRNTTAIAIASGKRAMRLATKRAKKREPFFAVSVYATLFPGITPYQPILFLVSHNTIYHIA
jgi:hypothetical protein